MSTPSIHKERESTFKRTLRKKYKKTIVRQSNVGMAKAKRHTKRKIPTKNEFGNIFELVEFTKM